jgi:hypothetical protein
LSHRIPVLGGPLCEAEVSVVSQTGVPGIDTTSGKSLTPHHGSMIGLTRLAGRACISGGHEETRIGSVNAVATSAT